MREGNVFGNAEQFPRWLEIHWKRFPQGFQQPQWFYDQGPADEFNGSQTPHPTLFPHGHPPSRSIIIAYYHHLDIVLQRATTDNTDNNRQYNNKRAARASRSQKFKYHFKRYLDLSSLRKLCSCRLERLLLSGEMTGHSGPPSLHGLSVAESGYW